MRHHHHHRTVQADGREAGVQEIQNHVCHRGVAEQLVEVLLAHGHESAVEEVANQPREHRHPFRRTLRQQQRGHADEQKGQILITPACIMAVALGAAP